jgi:hypothetical protein
LLIVLCSDIIKFQAFFLSLCKFIGKAQEEFQHAPNNKDRADWGSINNALLQLICSSLPCTDQPFATDGDRRGWKGNEFKGTFRW